MILHYFTVTKPKQSPPIRKHGHKMHLMNLKKKNWRFRNNISNTFCTPGKAVCYLPPITNHTSTLLKLAKCRTRTVSDNNRWKNLL